MGFLMGGMFVFSGFVIGLFTGLGLSYLYVRSRFIGRLRIDRSEPEEPPLLFLELHASVEKVSNVKYVILEVKNKNFISKESDNQQK